MAYIDEDEDLSEDGDEFDELGLVKDPDEIDEDVDFDLSRTRTRAPIRGDLLQDRLDKLGTRSPMAREIISDLVRIEQMMGDSNPQFADLASDIEGNLRLLFLELGKNPNATYMSILSSMDGPRQLELLTRMESLIKSRRTRIETELGGSE